MHILALTLALGLAVAPQAAAQPGTMAVAEKLAEGVYAFIAPDRLSDVDGNSVLVIGHDAALIVDTNTSAASARAVLESVRRLTDKPVAYIINTHWHYDHLLGNPVYKEAFPGARIVAHEETARIGRTWARYYPARANRTLPGTRERLQREAAAGRTADGQALTPLELRLTEAQLQGFDALAEKLAEAQYLLPEVTFRDSLTLDLGGRSVRLLNFGRGNTPGDAIVHVPDARVLVAGDLVVHPIPFGMYSYPASWIGVMKRLMEIDAAAIVPGHGPVMHDRTYIATVTDLLTSVVEQVRACVADNLNLEQTREKVDLEPFRKRLAGDDELRNYVFQANWVRPIVERAWREARGEY